MKGRETVAVDADQVFPRREQAADVLFVRVVGNLNTRRMDNDIGIDGENVLHRARRHYARGLTARNFSGVAPCLALAIDIKSGQFQIGMVDDRAQAGLAHRAGCPLNHSK